MSSGISTRSKTLAASASRNAWTRRRLAQIEARRRANNRLWMAILRVALESAPGETRRLLRQISRHDAAIQRALRQLAR